MVQYVNSATNPQKNILISKSDLKINRVCDSKIRIGALLQRRILAQLPS